MSLPKINVERVYPPIPVRCFDYAAYRDPEGLCGTGPTREEAIADLLEQEADQTWFERHQGLTGLLVALIFFASMGLAGRWDAQDEEKQEQAAASFWTAQGNKHFSGSGE